MSDEPIRMREKCYPPVWLILNSIKRGIYEQGAGDGNVRYFSQFKNSYGKVWVELGFFKPLVFFNVVFVFDFVRSLSLSPSLLLSLSLSIYVHLHAYASTTPMSIFFQNQDASLRCLCIFSLELDKRLEVSEHEN